ncbi:MAG: HAD-IC family P-type ATPase, partial [Candidatus Colwellbacteria bacterium]|nr:HAD-IC family P-type ATPase [Candidatus Colwellbacteria bacterium]
VIGIAVSVRVAAIFIEGIIAGRNPQEMFLISVAVAVAAIPEGLPIAMSVILAVGSQEILKKKGLIRRLASAETLGSTNIILMDKTGTLTQAKMELSGIFAGDGLFDNKEEKPGEDISDGAQKILKSAVLSSEAFIENFNGPVEKWIVRGRPTEKAIVESGIKAGLIKEEIQKKEPRIAELTFSSEWRYSGALHETEDGGLMIYSMGAPETVIEKSSRIERNGDVRGIRKEEKDFILNKANSLSAAGFRVLAAATKKVDGYQKKLDRDISDMVFLGLLVFSDPIRGEVAHALNSCRKAGIRPIIVTGDNSSTAKSIANSLGFEASNEDIIEGSELEKMSDDDLFGRIENIKIFARVAPVQKLRIVNAWQKKGMVVAMAGDGVNDAPAIKKADIGIALGFGTDAAKEAADFVLLNDSFVVIETAIEEGRRILDNIKKVITYVLSDSFTETLLVGIAIALGLPMPVTAAQILWVNLIEDGLPSISLAFEPKEKGIMARRPNANGSLLTREMKFIIFIIGIVTDMVLVGMFLLMSGHADIATVRTAVFALLALDSLFYSISCKNLRKNIWNIDIFSNKLLIFSILFGFVALGVAIYIPWFNAILGTVPIGASLWAIIIGLAFVNIILIEVAKFYFIKTKQTE